MNQQLQDYIKKEKEAGFNDEQIKQELLKVGWQEQDINQAFVDEPISAPLLTPKSEKIKGKNKSKLFLIIGIVVISVVVVVGVVFAYKYFKPSADEYIQEEEIKEQEVNVSRLPVSDDAKNDQIEDKVIQEPQIKDCGRAQFVEKTETSSSSSDEINALFSFIFGVPKTINDKEALKCFDNAFMNCEPSKIEEEFDEERGIIEIIGEKDSMCVFSMTDLIDPSYSTICMISKDFLSEYKEEYLKGVNDIYEEGTFFTSINFMIGFSEFFEDFPDNTGESTTDDISDYFSCE